MSRSVLERIAAVDAATFSGKSTFFSKYWETEPLLSRAADLPAGFGDLLTSGDIDGLVADRGLREPFFRLVDDAERVTGTTRRAVAGNRTISDLADPEAIRRAFADGATLVLQSLHRTWPPVAALCRGLAAELGHPMQCNAYVTPGGSARGLKFHHDTHDVFVLQVEGRKRWRIHAPVLLLPTRDQPLAGAHLVTADDIPLLDIVLEPGDTLYLPRGYVHAAETMEEASVHLTIGVLATTWLDLLQDTVTTLAREDLALRHAVPAEVDAEVTGAELLKLTTEWLGSLRPEDVAALARKRVAAARPPESLGMLAQAAAVDTLEAHTPVRPRAGLQVEVRREGDRVALVLPDRRILLPAQAETMIRMLVAGPASPSASIDGDSGCDVEDALVVVRRLLREGVLAPAA